MLTIDYTQTRRSERSHDLELLKQRAIRHGRQFLDKLALEGRQLSPRDDVDRAMTNDARTILELPLRDRHEVWTALLDYEFGQLHKERWR